MESQGDTDLVAILEGLQGRVHSITGSPFSFSTAVGWQNDGSQVSTTGLLANAFTLNIEKDKTNAVRLLM